MPQKYRRMADFHEYYSGARVAPYLTIFIGGNHEASNYLFELYYGGWVAPNIYYMGAANILRLGPLRIAGLSGIWKSYDYPKAHFERLPYNSGEYHSIFHVRELDVRKLLSVRSQVDIGLSHDWPKGVEWQGPHRWLFQRKDLFEADAISGKLGSVAAAQCLERLRPAYWFSAHLHIKYPALIRHGPLEQDRPQLSAWQNFHIGARRDDAQERDRVLKERQERQDEEARTGVRSRPQYAITETFKQVETTNGLGRSIASVVTSSPEPGESNEVPNLDGCESPSLKRRRGTSSPEVSEQQQNEHALASNDYPRTLAISTVDGTAVGSAAEASTKENNPDAVEIDMDDTDSETGLGKGLESIKPGTAVPLQTIHVATNVSSNGTTISFHDHQMSTSVPSDDGEDGGVGLNPLAQSFKPSPNNPSFVGRKRSEEMNPSAQPFTSSSSIIERRQSDEMNPLAQSFRPRGGFSVLTDPQEGRMNLENPISARRPDIPADDQSMYDDANDYQDGIGGAPTVDNEVSEEMRAQLAALSGSFAPKSIKKSEPLPFPEAINNPATQFLALDKCEYNREFLQLLEIEAICETSLQGWPKDRPFRLQYDPEWLAILRVFASDLELGGSPKDVVAPDRGETYYRDRIAEEAQWIEEHITMEGLLGVPENFSRTAPIYDPELGVDSSEMPREYTNPQTSDFCKLLGIDNPFDISEEKRNDRIALGPRPEADRRGFQGGRHGGRGGDGDRGRGGRHNNNRGGGRGGGRGRGRGRR